MTTNKRYVECWMKCWVCHVVSLTVEIPQTYFFGLYITIIFLPILLFFSRIDSFVCFLSYVFFRMSPSHSKVSNLLICETGERGGRRVLARAGSKLVTDYLMLGLCAWLQQSLGTERDGLSSPQDLWVDQAMSMGERTHVRFIFLTANANTVYEKEVEIEGDVSFKFFLPTSSSVTRLMAVWKHLTSYLSFIWLF